MAYRYMILDSQSTALARGYLESPPDSPVWYVRILDGGEDTVMKYEYLQLVSMDETAPAKSGRILRQKDNIIVLEPISDLDHEVQLNLRVLVKFSTYIYPVSGKWLGRVPAISHDMSCGGLAFYCAAPIEEKELVELVIPITSKPLVLKAEILRIRPSSADIPLYAARFVDMVREEEAMLCEAVFGQQIQNRGASGSKGG